MLQMSIIATILGIKLAFCQISYFANVYTGSYFIFTTYHMIHKCTSGKAHIK